ncbi:Amino acid transporter [Desulfonatronum thiosulfatophilum]|uniref:Amino acid transporter n=1 Tax=Desulfonatronum thiosulfatophilum TaxID=617002 RepID=A0A1G6A0B3_9BACT|nr:amino acid permease [Desulfonatronum thiosulfatophilum]SDB01879.1 Amino acid transporter [Desulfonatronum thiosulfatophilum]
MPDATSCRPASNEKLRGGLSVADGVAVLVGVVIGIGIFGFPPLVAQQAETPYIYMGLWLAGGLIMLLGALCYAELGSTYPHAGGEYHFLQRAWGSGVGVLFAWARGTVIQTGSIAAVAFIYGEYAQQLVPLGAWGAAMHAAVAIMGLTALNIVGTREAKRAQILFSSMTVLALALVIGGGLLKSAPAMAEPIIGAGTSTALSGNPAGALGMGMVFVLLTYGGWNETAYLSGELRDPQRSMSRVLLLGAAIVIFVYVLANLSYLHIFGLEGLRETHAVGAQMMQLVAGPRAAFLLSVMVCIVALSTLNATILTGARVYYALGRDVPRLSMLGAWSERSETPVRALALQGLITLALVLFGAMTQDGIGTMVAYTAPVFWLFMLLTAMSVFALRHRDPLRRRPFRVPVYPLTPLLFGITCLGLLWSSTLYAGPGAIVGLGVLAAGAPLLLLRGRNTSTG